MAAKKKPTRETAPSRSVNVPFTQLQLEALIAHLEDENGVVMSLSVSTTCTALKSALVLSKTGISHLVNNRGNVALRKAVVLLHADAPELAEQVSAYVEVEDASEC